MVDSTRNEYSISGPNSKKLETRYVLVIRFWSVRLLTNPALVIWIHWELSLLKRVNVIMSKERGRWDLFWRKFMTKPVSTPRPAHQLARPPALPLANNTLLLTRTLARNVEWRPEEILMAFTMMEIMIMFSSRNGLLRTPIKGLRKQCKPPP